MARQDKRNDLMRRVSGRLPRVEDPSEGCILVSRPEVPLLICLPYHINIYWFSTQMSSTKPAIKIIINLSPSKCLEKSFYLWNKNLLRNFVLWDSEFDEFSVEFVVCHVHHASPVPDAIRCRQIASRASTKLHNNCLMQNEKHPKIHEWKMILCHRKSTFCIRFNRSEEDKHAKKVS